MLEILLGLKMLGLKIVAVSECWPHVVDVFRIGLDVFTQGIAIPSAGTICYRFSVGIGEISTAD